MVEEDYIIRISNYLRNFKKLKANKYQFSCPICGDSQKVRSKARGNLFIYKGEWVYHCYNCGASHRFSTFLKKQFPDLYQEYVFDRFNYSKKGRIQKKEEPLDVGKKKPEFKTDFVFSGDDVIRLNYQMNHSAVLFLSRRNIPENFIDEMYFTKNFKKWVNDTLIPNKFEHTDKPDPRIIIPFWSKDKKLIGVQGRTILAKNKVRYITIKLIPDSEPLLFGLDRADQSKDIFVLEGPIDSMFIDNAVAWAGGSLHKVNGVLFPILVWDNEPRNKDINKQIQKAINDGHRVVIWPKRNTEKDINDMIIAGINVDAKYLKDNTYKGLEAQLKFDQWRK